MTQPPALGDVIQVAGDPTVDWMLVNPTGAQLQISYHWESQATVRIAPFPGGAAQLSIHLRTLCEKRPWGIKVLGPELPDSVIFDPRSTAVTRSFQVWDLFPVEAGSADITWREREFVGQEHGDERTPYAAAPESPAPPVVLVLDDTNLGFRDNRDAWPSYLRDEGAALPRHIILRMSNPLASGPLWEALMQRCPERVTLHFSAADLRKEYAAIGEPLSWERSSSEVVKAVRERSVFSAVGRVIVSLSTAGAVIIEGDGRATLIFDPHHQEGDWEQRRPGLLTGVGTCMVLALAIEAARNAGDATWVDAVQRGLLGARALHQHGFRHVEGVEPSFAGFPISVISEALRGEASNGVYEAVPVSMDEGWTMFAAAFPEGYERTARRIVVEGEEEACRSLPIERVGLWSSMDRNEIESMRSVRGIMREYVGQTRRVRPLSVAVFGPPGSGKSFAIKQMAHEWNSGATRVRELTFNLSQYLSLDELPRAFQAVRDCAVEGVLPLVFWDEFDTALGGREFGWLASFLAPMQDGVFIENGATRPIGPAIFVFAGGTHPTMESFNRRASELAGAKATDFLSRLRGYVDILGPNPSDEHDRTFVLRRASQLRTLLRQRAPQLFRAGRPNIDPGILNAFLNVDRYIHGTRSIESLLDMSALSGRLRYERSSLPARHQLSLHVDADRFLTLVRAEAAV